jgi:hypothetical protein
MNTAALLCIPIVAAASGLAHAQGKVYQSLGSLADHQSRAIAVPKPLASPPVRDAASALPASTRPQLSGQRDLHVELLEDALLRKHGSLLRGNRALARQLILRRYHHAEGPLRGYMAEAIFIDRNPGWHYVRKPNATQHDVYRWLDTQRPPYTGQIKYHDAGRPHMYASDMVVDHRSPRFFIPDDHVQSTKRFLLEQAQRADSAGNAEEVARLRRDYARVRPIGASSTEIRSATIGAAGAVARETRGVYASLGGAAALSLAPGLIDLATGKGTAEAVQAQAAQALPAFFVAYGTDKALSRYDGGVLRASARGSAIVATTMAIVHTASSIHRHGGRQAIYQPDFYFEAVGGASAVALAVAGGAVATTAAAGTGPAAPLVGAGAGLVLGTVGYLGGRAVTYELLERFAPDILHRAEQQRFDVARDVIDRRIFESQALTRTNQTAAAKGG